MCSFGISASVLALFLFLAMKWITLPLLVVFLLLYGCCSESDAVFLVLGVLLLAAAWLVQVNLRVAPA